MAYIDDRIAELEQRIAEKRAYQRMYPSHKYASTWDYVAEGDRSGFDRMDASEAAYRNMLEQQSQQLNMLKAQQDFTTRENELNRKNAKEIASRTNSGYGSTDETAKLMREIEFAKAEYDAAKDNLEIGNSSSEANYKKAASKYNYWIKQLPHGFEGYTPFTLDVNEVGTSPRIKAQRVEEAHNQNVSDLKTLMDSELGATEWTESIKRKVYEYLGKLDPEKDKVVIAEYRNKVRDKGDTKETKDRNYMTSLREFAKLYNDAGNEEQSELQKDKPKLYKDAKSKGLIK